MATVHGLYEVAAAAGVPGPIAWLYPLITDGLALVAYTATARLTGPARRYAWIVVALAAGLSGLAQAAYLAGAADSGATPPATTPSEPGSATGTAESSAAFEAAPALRFGVGAWPAIAAAIVAHLLYLLAVDHPATDHTPTLSATERDPNRAGDPAATDRHAVGRPGLSGDDRRADERPAEHAVEHPAVEYSKALNTVTVVPAVHSGRPAPSRRRPAALNGSHPEQAVVSRAAVSPARDRAATQAAAYLREHDRLPTVSELVDRAEVSRGTAAAVLKDLRT
ncbi:DUF2637 domain-containing protein [Pseudonocardia humida]|uniref:DUF2637 domain-containing protein n=1 Tax=Pseudonocardia humida TaxID=2800819 RepID=A0ABT1A8Q4_9PSEU|nr:hypothetical protein [Pseudonocardia humida]